MGYIVDKDVFVDYYFVFDVFLYISLYDNVFLVVLEVMVCGLFVICFDIGGILELV